MADKMSKEEAKKEFDRWFNPDYFPNRDLLVYEVDYLIDSIEPEHKKVVLPKEVGEQWDKLVASQTTDDQGVTTTDYGLTKLARYDLDGDRFHELVEWWDHTSNSYETLINAAKYGWVAKPQPDKLYRVYVPGTDQVYVYTHRVWSDRKVHLEVQEIEEQSDDLTELFTERQIDELRLQDYEREEVINDGELRKPAKS